MTYFWLKYQNLVKGNTNLTLSADTVALSYWQDQLFLKFLIYCLPFSFIATVPGIIVSFKDGYTYIGMADFTALVLLTVVTLASGFSLHTRKIAVVVIFYLLAIFLISSLGHMGPGVFYLFGMTILIALIFPIANAYWSILLNSGILLTFGAIIATQSFNGTLNKDYSTAAWIAFSSNVIFLSLVIVSLIHQIFNRLQLTITHQNQAQEKYKLIFDRSPLPMWLFDIETLRFLDVNEAAVRNYGYSKNEFLLMTIRDIRPAGQIQLTEQVVKKNKITGEFYTGVAEHLKKDGENIYVKVESNLIEVNGRPVRLVLATDITEQLKNEVDVYNANIQVRNSEADLRAIFESSTDGFVLLDSAFKIKAFNPKARSYIKLQKGDASFETGKSIYDFVELKNLNYFKSVIKRVYSGTTVDYDRRHRDAEGNKHWIRYTVTPVYENKRINGACITGRDVTLRKLYLKNLEDQNKTFREISWMQSHLVRAPIARLMGLIPLFKAATDDQERAELADYCNTSILELDEIVKNISQKSNAILEKYPAPETEGSDSTKDY